MNDVDPRRILQARLDDVTLLAHRIRWAERRADPSLLDHIAALLSAARALYGDAHFLALTRRVLLHVASLRIELDPTPPPLCARSSLPLFSKLSAQATAMTDRVLAEMQRLEALLPSTQLESVVLEVAAAYVHQAGPAEPTGRAA